ncbi:MAG: radical SAM protein [Candidatus Omnitrophica bacterium]|nr:radical SAM protein [Candidatus Omnitrophota bacterium]
MIPLRNIPRFFTKACRQPGYALGVFGLRMMAYAHYAAGAGFAFVPESLTLFLTHRCNLRCKMCGQWGEGGVTKQEGPDILKAQLSFAEYQKLLDDIAGVWRPSITLFGGEPLLYASCMELISYIKGKGMHCLMITNGSMLEAVARSLVESGLDELNISLDGSRQLHDDIRGMPGLFDRIMAGIDRVNRAKAVLRTAKPLINLQSTITRYNYRQLEQMLAVAETAKANSLTFHNLIFLDRQTMEKQKAFDERLGSTSGEWEGFVCEPGIDPGALEHKRREIISRKTPFSVDFYPNFSCAELVDYYRNPCYQPPAQNCRCVSPWLVAYVFPDGEVRPCLNSSYSFGNVKELPFGEIWNSQSALKFRRLLRQSRMFPACVRCTELYRY